MWFLYPQLAHLKSRIRPIQRLRSIRSVDYTLSRQREELNIVKRERWTEAELEDLPTEESDVFERKSGKLFDFEDQTKFLDSVAKALSAFANSGGGSLIIGVDDNGTPDGLPATVGRAAMRDWIEQKTPHLLDYPISDFRVHTVIKSDPSRIPADKEVIVIDVGDSAAAPHQHKRDKVYYRREGGDQPLLPIFI
jgi:predicted HTH transcriptional regulator